MAQPNSKIAQILRSWRRNWSHDWCGDPSIRKIVSQKLYDDTVQRSVIVSCLFGVAFITYGFTVTGYLQKFVPHLTYWDNVWPRVVFNGIPFFLLAYFLRTSKGISSFAKCRIWAFCFALIFHIACWIYVWPAVLKGNAQILGVVNAANLFVITFAYLVVSPPNRLQLFFLASIIGWFLVPFGVVAYLSGDKILFQVLVSDQVHIVLLNIALSSMINQIRARLAVYDIRHHQQAEKFLGSWVSKAIFESREDMLKARKAKGFFLSLDIRGYTNLLKALKPIEASSFMSEYHRFVSEIIGKHRGFIHKTIGDGHLISFGVMDQQADLSNVPGVEHEEALAEQRRNKFLLRDALTAVEEVIVRVQSLSQKTGDLGALSIGAGISYGEAEVKVFGHESHRQELDVFGSVIIQSTRLESYSKYLARRCLPGSSVLVIAPDVSDFVDDRNYFLVAATKENPVRDFHNLEWVLFRAFVPSKRRDSHAVGGNHPLAA